MGGLSFRDNNIGIRWLDGQVLPTIHYPQYTYFLFFQLPHFGLLMIVKGIATLWEKLSLPCKTCTQCLTTTINLSALSTKTCALPPLKLIHSASYGSCFFNTYIPTVSFNMFDWQQDRHPSNTTNKTWAKTSCINSKLISLLLYTYIVLKFAFKSVFTSVQCT